MLHRSSAVTALSSDVRQHMSARRPLSPISVAPAHRRRSAENHQRPLQGSQEVRPARTSAFVSLCSRVSSFPPFPLFAGTGHSPRAQRFRQAWPRVTPNIDFVVAWTEASSRQARLGIRLVMTRARRPLAASPSPVNTIDHLRELDSSETRRMKTLHYEFP